MQVLVALARADGAVVSRDQLIERCWGGRLVGDDAINSCVAKVRALAAMTSPSAFDIETIPDVAFGRRLYNLDGLPDEQVAKAMFALRRQGIQTSTLLLAGVAVSLSCSAIILFLQYLSDSTQTFRMVRWMMGGLSVVGYTEVLWLVPWVLGGSAALFALRWELNLLLTGEEMAASRGVDLARLRRLVLLATSLMIGALVAVAGPIGFVGLIVPHMLRRLVGHDHLFLIPACILGGGAFLTLCDAGARTLMAPAELPVGILTALLGGPFFLWLLVLRKRQ